MAKNEEVSVKSKYGIDLTLLEEQDVEDLMVSALEGGSNYWYLIKEDAVAAVRKAAGYNREIPFVMKMMKAISKGVEVQIHDAENEDEVLGTLTKDSWAKGEKLLMTKQYKRFLVDVLEENADAETGDVFFQLCLMGEIVYG